LSEVKEAANVGCAPLRGRFARRMNDMTTRIPRARAWPLPLAAAALVAFGPSRSGEDAQASVAPQRPVAAAADAVDRLERRLYVADRSGLSLYDIDDGHRLLRRIEVPESGGYKGIAASPALGRLYITSHLQDELICLDLQSERVVWRKKYGKYPDSLAITPDGRTLYVPFRGEDNWRVIGASEGDVVATIAVGRGKNYDVDPIGSIGPHNTWMNPAGTRVYMEVLTLPYVFIASTATNTIIGRIGPFSKGVRPFTVTDDERYVFANVDGLLGFEVGAVRRGSEWGGPMLQRVEARTAPERLAQVNPPARRPHSTPSHGINLRPDQKEVWVVDGVYGYVYAFDATIMPPRQVASIPLFDKAEERPHPGWVSFSLDGSYAYPDGGVVIDTRSKQVVARIPTSEKLIEIDFRGGKPVRAGHR
jgi:DNA-binding beta-propeller fold protein YncE